MNESINDDITIKGEGAFTPPPAPCGGKHCDYVLHFRPDGSEIGWEVEHGPGCDGE